MSLFKELKRRNVFRVGLAYLVSAWVVAQVADLVLDNIDAPAWVMQVILLVLGLGFVIALIVSWAYELTPEGLKKDADVATDKSIATHTAKKLDYITIVAATVVLGLVFFQQLNPRKVVVQEPTQVATVSGMNKSSASKTDIDDASIAVLPFADLSPEGNQEYFSDGIAEELLNVLVRVEGLKVASRTSAFGFKGQEALGIPLIAEKLKVRHVLEGSVRKAGNTVRITAQLIDAQNDVHLWSETYDRPLNTENIFAVQDEISAEIVKALQTELNVELGDTEAIKMDTENLDAYEMYLKARQMFFKRSLENLPSIIELAEKATEIDPTFAQAWAGLAAVYSVAPSWGVAGDDHIERAVAAANKAISLDAKLALPHAVLQNTENNFLPIDYVKAMAHSDQALALDPKNSTAQLWRGIDELSLGFFEQAIFRFNTCLELDPAYDNCLRFLALTHLYAGNKEQAFEIFDQSMLTGSTSQMGPFYRALLVEGKLREGIYMLVLSNNTFNIGQDIEKIYRRWTDPDFNFEQELKIFISQYQVKNNDVFNWNKLFLGPITAYQYKQYDKINPEYHSMIWWERADVEFLKSPHRKRIMREIGIYDYWLATEFPPQCRAKGEDDFECD